MRDKDQLGECDQSTQHSDRIVSKVAEIAEEVHH